MVDKETAGYFEYIIRDTDSYRSVLSAANVEISQLEPGRLSGRHVRLDLPGGQFSFIETNLSMRSIGSFPDLWTLSVVLESEGRSLQHGVEVHAGSLLIHGPGAENDGVYGRNFKIICFSLREQVFAKFIRRLSPKLKVAIRQPWSVFEPATALRREITKQFAEAASIIRSDPRVRDSDRALAKFEEELVSGFMEAVSQQAPSHSSDADQRTGMVQRVDHVAQQPSLNGTSVVKICAACQVPRRTLNRAFQEAVGMGPVTYLRRVRLNRARRALLSERERPITVTDVALAQGFWHLGRFAEQYNKMFDESPHETLRRSD